MKKAFTLIELLIVVSIIATLMTITFRIGSSTSDETAKRNTVLAIQKLENCLSGYNAAFGSYPPVKIYGTRNIYAEVKENVQQEGDEGSSKDLRWDQIRTACCSQPVDCAFPFNQNMRDEVDEFSAELQQILADGHHDNWEEDSPYIARVIRSGFGIGDPGDFSGELRKKDSWTEVQIFKFGLMSYLLPRYLVMMTGDEDFYGADGSTAFSQWESNNDKCISVEDGQTEFTWRDVYDYVDSDTTTRRDYAKVANLPAQAVCARWIANLQGLCTTSSGKSLFGVDVASSGSGLMDVSSLEEPDSNPPQLNVYSPGGKGGNYYLLDTVSVHDGWGQPLYYYTPNGAQSYTLWSGGKNLYTFPPWIDASGLMDEWIKKGAEGKYENAVTVSEAIADDIVRMRN